MGRCTPAISLTLVISVSKDVVLGGTLRGAFNLGFHIVLATGCVLGMAPRRYVYHQILGVALAAVIAVYIGLLFTRLQWISNSSPSLCWPDEPLRSLDGRLPTADDR